MNPFDIAIIGGGIVGAATAMEMVRRYPDARIILIEKEPAVACHQTGHNSGVVHAGVYYQPGSLKAEFCKKGAELTRRFCREHGLAYRRTGKLLVATNPVEWERMAALEDRCRENRIEVHRVSRPDLKKMEPNINGLGALMVPATAITDYITITRKMAHLFSNAGGVLMTGTPVTDIREEKSQIRLFFGPETITTRFMVACGGLMADRLARMAGIHIDFTIIPFRGEYYQLPRKKNRIVTRLIYPVPDPDLPFLGVHLTPMIDGCVTVGPNAVLGFKREGYGRLNFNARDVLQMAAFPGFWQVMKQHLGSGIFEFIDSNYRPGYLKRIQKYCPSLTVNDLKPYPAGTRAQAVRHDGTLVHDFLFAESKRTFHVCNAPSPAATSAIPIGHYICDKVGRAFNL